MRKKRKKVKKNETETKMKQKKEQSRSLREFRWVWRLRLGALQLEGRLWAERMVRSLWRKMLLVGSGERRGSLSLTKTNFFELLERREPKQGRQLMTKRYVYAASCPCTSN